MDRKPLLYVVIFMVPLFYLLVLDLASFFISESRGEKLGFKITILLSISVLLLILKDILPSTEDNLPMIGESSAQVWVRGNLTRSRFCRLVAANFCAGIFALVGLSVLEAMLVTFLTDLDSFCVRKKKKKKKPVEVELEVGKHIGKSSFGGFVVVLGHVWLLHTQQELFPGWFFSVIVTQKRPIFLPRER